jgi:ribosomal protein S18 acetylase RimI-like enzyme
LPQDYLDALRPEDRMTHYDFANHDAMAPATIVVVDDDSLKGFATTGHAGADTPTTGELMALYVDPAAWGCGIGRRLIEEARTRLRQSGLTDALLWVLVGNERAARFYRRADDRPMTRRRDAREYGQACAWYRARRRRIGEHRDERPIEALVSR